MSDFTFIFSSPNSNSPVPNPPQVGGDFSGFSNGTVNGNGGGGATPPVPAMFGTSPLISVCGWGGDGNFYVIVPGAQPQTLFTSVALGAPANLNFLSASATAFSTSVIPGYTYWRWPESHEYTYLGQNIPVTFTAPPAPPNPGQGDIPNPNSWINAAATLGVGTVSGSVAQGDITNPNAWSM